MTRILNAALRRSTTAACWLLTTWRSIGSVSAETTYRTLGVHVIHRHGDRSPITPMADEKYWKTQLIPPSQLDKIAENTVLRRDEGAGEFKHAAGGKGPVFGKLTELGLLQMIKVGLNLKEELTTAKELLYSPIFDPNLPIPSDKIKVISTDFPRTIQSVQGLLLGLLEDSDDDNEDFNEQQDPIEIDVRHTTMMIPDPQPRVTREQELLEAYLTNLPHVLAREKEYLDLAQRATKALHPLLGSGAREVAFGVVQEHPEHMSIEVEPLAWNQLAEITKCLAVRDLLPKEITKDDVDQILEHTAWRWFQTLSNPRLIYLALHRWVSQQVEFMKDVHNQPPVTIWSCHDSSLIGLLCAYRLEKPSSWPEYSSVLMIELVEVTNQPSAKGDTPKKELAVRFSLNGERLRCMWDPEEPVELLSLEELDRNIRSEGSQPSDSDLGSS